DCDFVPQSLAELSNSKSLRVIDIDGGDDNGKVELNLSILKKLSHIRTIARMNFEECIFPSYWAPAFTDGFSNLVIVFETDCNLTEDDVREMLKERKQNNLGGIDWEHDFVEVGDTDVVYDWDQSAGSIIQADIDGHSNWWAWFLGVFVVGGISVGWWRIKLRTKTSDSIEEQISDLNEESST
ncbi:MAG: hypothetical protein NZ807_07395, partial [Dehalococcoidia bacterium]|nr:hypothetical protein [Dehalococcoidia bacterium]